MDKKNPLRVLLIDFNIENITKIKTAFSMPSDILYEVSWLQKESNILKKIDEEKFDVILISYNLPDMNGLELLTYLQYKDLLGPVIMMADKGDEGFALQAIREGAYDYVIRDEGFENRLSIVIHNALNSFRSFREKERLQKEIYVKQIELESANRRLIELDRIKSDFVANVSHEFKTPLTIIKGSIELVMEERIGGLTSKQKEVLEGAVRVTARLTRLIKDLLDISKIESGKVPLNKTPLNINKIIEESSSSFDTIIRDKNLIFEKNLSQDIIDIKADLDKITQVIVNLLSNAIKYTPEGGKIQIKTLNLDEGILVEVSDTGEGIAGENLDKIFDKFTRVTVEKKEGTGLGLPIANDIISLHNGRMWVQSELGKGSHFYFTLPK